MITIASLILPVFTLVLIGFLFAYFKILKAPVIEALSTYIFNAGVPFLLFRAMQSAQVPEVSPWAYWGAFFIAAFVAGGMVYGLAKKALGLEAAKVGSLCVAAGYGNTVLLALPLILSVIGEEQAAVPIFLLLAVHLPLMTIASTVLMEAQTSNTVAVGAIMRTVAKRLVRHPILIGLTLGLVVRISGLPLPQFASISIDMMADAAVPLALFALGASLTLYELKGDGVSATLVMSAKMLLHPALVWGLSVLFGLPPVWVVVNVLFAAAPPGINAFLFAQNYKAGVGAVSLACAIGTGLSVVSYTLWLWLLGV